MASDPGTIAALNNIAQALQVSPLAAVLSSNVVITSNTTVSGNGLFVLPGGGWIKSGSSTLNITSPIMAGPYQIFFGFSAGDVTFGTGSVKEVYPEWWGAKGDGTTDDTSAVNQAIACARKNTGGVAHLSKIYSVISINVSSASADFTKTLTIRGNGMLSSGFIGTSATDIVVDAIGTNYLTMEDFGITGVGKTGLLLARSTVSQNCNGHRFKNIWINGSWSVASCVSIASESNNWVGCKFWNTNATNNYMTFYTSGSNDELSFTSPNGTIFESSNTDVKMFGPEFYAPYAGANLVKFYRQAQYAFYSAFATTGGAAGGNIATYKVKSGENSFDGPVTWYTPLFEGQTPTAHLLDGPNGVVNYFKGINSYSGYYNQYGAGTQNVMVSTSDQSFLSTSQFIGAKYNNSASPLFSVWYVEKSTIDMRSFGGITSMITIATAQESSILLAATVNEGASSVNYHGETFGTAAPTTGTYAKGHRHWNSSPTVGQPKSWVCTVSGSPGTWVSEGNL